MPPRTNLFQKVIKTVYEHQADQPVEESKMLEDSQIDAEREVDVLITDEVAGEVVTVGVEITAQSRPLQLPAVQAMIRKHQKLGTSRVVIVSRSGFTGTARREIDTTPGFVGYQPKDLTDRGKFEARIVGELSTLWQSRFSVTLTEALARVELPEKLLGTNIVDWIRPGPVFPLVDREGNEITTPEALFLEWARRSGNELATSLGVADSTDDRRKTFLHDLLPPWVVDGCELGDLYINVNTNTQGGLPNVEPLKLVLLDLRGPAEIRVSKFDLKHQQLNERLAYSVGEAEIDGEQTLLVVSASPKGEKMTTLSLGTTAPSSPTKPKPTERTRTRRRAKRR